MNYITYKILHIKHDPHCISGYEYDGNHKAIWWREAKWAGMISPLNTTYYQLNGPCVKFYTFSEKSMSAKTCLYVYIICKSHCQLKTHEHWYL